MYHYLAIIGALASWSVAQEESAPASTASTVTSASATASSTNSASSTSESPMTHTVLVAKAGFTFQPDVTLANVGDVIEFDFYPTNHSVIRSQYGYPCIPYEDTGVDLVGFFSGFEPVDGILPDPPKWSITVNDTDPIFYYCGATGSCLNYGMVGVINPNATTNIETQKALALNSTFMLLPGEPWPSEEQDPFTTASTVTPTPTATSTSTSASVPASSTTAASSSTPTPAPSHSGLSGGAIAGIAIGASAVALLAAALIYLCGRQSRHSSHNPHNPHHSLPPSAFIQPHSGMHSPAMTSYVSPNKHMSTAHHSLISPALPGYVPQHDPAMSPPLPHSYPVSRSDALEGGMGAHDMLLRGSVNGSEVGSQAGPAPAYQGGQTSPTQETRFSDAILPHGVHEMPGNDRPESGIMGFIRRSSLRKTGGVERYG